MNNLDARLLKKLIKEVIQQKIDEAPLEECGMEEADLNKPEVAKISNTEIDPDGYEGYMAKGNLYKMAKSASELHDLFADNENLEPWVQEKIAVAARMIDDVADYMEYAKLSKNDQNKY